MSLFAAMSLVLAACGGSGADEPETAASPTSTPRPTATPDLGCSTDDGEQVFDLLSEVSQRWDDAVALADQTPRMQLAGQIGNLQEIRRDAQNQEWPKCGDPAQEALVAGMNAGIEGFIAFLGDEEQSVIDDHFADYQREMRLFQTALIAIQ